MPPDSLRNNSNSPAMLIRDRRGAIPQLVLRAFAQFQTSPALACGRIPKGSESEVKPADDRRPPAGDGARRRMARRCHIPPATETSAQQTQAPIAARHTQSHKPRRTGWQCTLAPLPDLEVVRDTHEHRE